MVTSKSLDVSGALAASIQTGTAPHEDGSTVIRNPAAEDDAISFQLQRARVDAGLSIVELSRLTGISKTVLHGYERSRTKPGAREIRLLCSALHISPNRLILGNDDFETDTPGFTSFYRKIRARPQLAALFYSMSMPLMASLLDEEEVKSVLFLVSNLVRARNPDFSDQLMMGAQEVMKTLDSVTMPDGAITISEENLQSLITETHQRIQNNLEKLNQSGK